MTGLKHPLRSRRGFTLVELIVVLVILGVLAAFTVPALTGYIDTAKEKQAVSEAQTCVATATNLAAQKYAAWQQDNIAVALTGGKDEHYLQDWAGTVSSTAPAVTGGTVALTEGSGQYLLGVESPPRGGTADQDVAPTAGVSGHVSALTCSAGGQVVYLVYTSKDGITVVYTNDATDTTVDTGIDKADVPKPGDGGKDDSGKDDGGKDDGKDDGGKDDGGSDTTPELPEGALGFLTFNFRDVDGFTGIGITNVKIVNENNHSQVFFSGKTNSGGSVYVPIYREGDTANHVVADGLKNLYTMQVETPDGRQQVFDFIFKIGGDDENFRIDVYNNTNNNMFYRTAETSADGKTYTCYNAKAAEISIRFQDEFGKAISGIQSIIKTGEYASDTIATPTSGDSDYMLAVKMHAGDNFSASSYRDISGYSGKDLYIQLVNLPDKYVSPTRENKLYFNLDQETTNGTNYGAGSVTVRNNNDKTYVSTSNNSIVITLRLQQVITFHSYAQDEIGKELRNVSFSLQKLDPATGSYSEEKHWSNPDYMDSPAQQFALTSGTYKLVQTAYSEEDYYQAPDIAFTLTNIDGTSTMKLEGTPSSSIDAATCTVTAINPLKLKTLNIQIIDKTTGASWAGASVTITGDLGNRSDQDRNWTTGKDTQQTFKAPLGKGDYVITVNENNIYAQTKLGFSISADGTLIVLPKKGSDGYIQNRTIYVYAEPRFVVTFSGPGTSDIGSAKAKITNGTTTVIEELRGDTNNNVSLPTGNYTLIETRTPQSKHDSFNPLPQQSITIQRSDDAYPIINKHTSNPWNDIPTLNYQYTRKS